MGLFDFIKGAGRKEKEEAGVDKRNQELIKANKIKRFVLGLGLEIEDLKIELTDDVATVHGTAKTQGDREKAILAVGNTEGIARVDDRMNTAAPEPEATFYTVQRGDSLSLIAKAQYGDPMKYPVIFDANRPLLEDPDKIYPGQVLRIPALT